MVTSLRQVGRASTVNGGPAGGSRGANTISTSLLPRTSMSTAVSVPGGGAGGSGMAPMRIPIGNNQEVIVTVQHQQ